ncbi:uncharacterized protein RhaS with RHS repeats, partial [Chryseobacterium lathyri]|nr:uncharacterized protein RhaS with RHS repeats [Chryseobacterium lathyri]
ALSSNSYGNPLMIAPYGKIAMIDRNVSTASGGFYSTQVLESYPIESGKFLLDEVQTKDYINGSFITTKINNQYSINDIQKPINLLKQTVIHTNNDKNTETKYQYAYEKSNQKLIDANMVNIPLETEVKKNGKPVSRSETRYDDFSHKFPTSVKTYDLQSNSENTVLTYDKYDAKGNILQYTTEHGSPVALVWGYNNTQPIAKVEGITYDQLASTGLISSVVSASDADASNPANEPALITALDQFRNAAALINTKITTLTYDLNIGVTSTTSDSGIRQIYKYDNANRLEKITDQEGKPVKELQYNYKQ